MNERAMLETTAAEWLNAKIKPQIWGVTINGASMSVASGLAKRRRLLPRMRISRTASLIDESANDRAGLWGLRGGSVSR